ncbi:MAG: hypothetical protein BWY76_03032 [bacterium ADurb.Bin429]|nr:MAG: hypothetical protein BWY76_03032 [bacterium ADurb.Bin429]
MVSPVTTKRRMGARMPRMRERISFMSTGSDTARSRRASNGDAAVAILSSMSVLRRRYGSGCPSSGRGLRQIIATFAVPAGLPKV